MRNRLVSLILTVTILGFFLNDSFSQNVNYLTPEPLSKIVNTSLKPVKSSSSLKVPLITWGGDVATILADMDGIFKDQGMNVSLFREDDFKKQVQMCLSGETPYIRGTMGMINAASDAFKNSGTELVVIYQLTWSVGGDAMVVRSGKKLNNMKTVALQLYGPHMDYASNLLEKSGRLNHIDFKWLSQLTISNLENGKIVDPVTAFQESSSVDAVMCIIPDALLLTSNGTIGTGSEGSVKGAKILLSTKTSSRIIADVYAVRKDYFDANKDKVQRFVKALMISEEKLSGIMKNKETNQAKYRQLMSKSADLLLGSSQFTSDAEALLGDCEFVGYNGNKSFFTGVGTTRNFKNLNKEIQKSFKSLGILTTATKVQNAGWDYSVFAGVLRNPTTSSKSKQRFDKKKVAKEVESQIMAEASNWEDDGTIFVVEIYFSPNQSEFSTSKYANDFAKALDIAETNSGALVIIEGHSDPLGILKEKKALREKKAGYKSKAEIGQMEQRAKSLSFERAEQVRDNFLKYCKAKGINIDDSQFIAVGIGTHSPKFNPPRTEDEWAANRRVVFRIKQIEAELDKFTPLD